MRLKVSVVAFVAAVVISTLRHDIYQVGLAVASIILCTWVARCFERKVTSLAVLITGSVVLAQLSVLIRQAFLEEGLWTTAKANPLGFIVGDLVYGFKSVVLVLYQSTVALIQAVGWSDYSSLESLNYRFAVVGWLLVGLSIYLLLIKQPTKSPVKR